MNSDEHRQWLERGQAQLGRGHLRRALGSFRRSQQTDWRGENAFQLHTAIDAITVVLLQQRRFFLHVHDESKLFGLPAPVTVDLEALARRAVALKGELTSSVHGALEAIATCAKAGALLPDYANQSAVLELEASGTEVCLVLANEWLAAEKSLYEGLLAREEALISGA
jgi:hypothetical protein